MSDPLGSLRQVTHNHDELLEFIQTEFGNENTFFTFHKDSVRHLLYFWDASGDFDFCALQLRLPSYAWLDERNDVWFFSKEEAALINSQYTYR